MVHRTRCNVDKKNPILTVCDMSANVVIHLGHLEIDWIGTIGLVLWMMRGRHPDHKNKCSCFKSTCSTSRLTGMNENLHRQWLTFCGVQQSYHQAVNSQLQQQVLDDLKQIIGDLQSRKRLVTSPWKSHNTTRWVGELQIRSHVQNSEPPVGGVLVRRLDNWLKDTVEI